MIRWKEFGGEMREKWGGKGVALGVLEMSEGNNGQ